MGTLQLRMNFLVTRRRNIGAGLNCSGADYEFAAERARVILASSVLTLLRPQLEDELKLLH